MTGIWAIYFRYEAYRGRCAQASIKFFEFHEATRMSRNSKALNLALIWCGCENPPKRVYEKFQKSGKFSAEIALPDQKDASGEALLNLAIAADDAAAIPLDRGAEVNSAGRGGFTQVQRAYFCKNENIFRILLSSGADVDAENDAKLSAQILRGRICGRKMQAS